MRYFLILLPLYTWVILLLNSPTSVQKQWDIQTPVAEVLTALDNDTHPTKAINYNFEQATIGEDLVKNGFTKKHKVLKPLACITSVQAAII
jgi:hypothetical protein